MQAREEQAAKVEQEFMDKWRDGDMADHMAEADVAQLEDREVWDANEMSPDELAQLMQTWTAVADE